MQNALPHEACAPLANAHVLASIANKSRFTFFSLSTTEKS
jgi:hypothetical protein